MESSFVAARDELVKRMECMFYQPVYRYFGALWLESSLQAARESVLQAPQEEDVIVIFRKKLEDIKNWTSTRMNEEYENITKSKERLFDLLMTKIFSLNSRILSFAAEVPRDYIKIQIPDDRRFVHAVFLATGRMFSLNPYLLSRRKIESPYRQIIATECAIKQVVSDTVRNLTCLEDVFLPQTQPVSSVIFESQLPPPNFIVDAPINTPIATTDSIPITQLDPILQSPVNTSGNATSSFENFATVGDDIKYIDKVSSKGGDDQSGEENDIDDGGEDEEESSDEDDEKKD